MDSQHSDVSAATVVVNNLTVRSEQIRARDENILFEKSEKKL
jgi:hypothetical protein